MYRIGIDLGGTNIAAGIVNEKFEIVAQDSTPTLVGRPSVEIVDDIAALCQKLCDKIAIIKKGQLRAFKSMQELNEEGIELEKFYLDIIYDGNDEHVPYVEAEPVEEANA